MKKILAINEAMCNKPVIMITLVVIVAAVCFVTLTGNSVTAAFANNDHWGLDPGHRQTVQPSKGYGNSSTPSDTFGGQQ
jgi:hypothetical protein